MPNFGLLTGTQERSYGGLPTLPLINLVAERAVTEPSQFNLVSRPRLQYYTSGAWGGSVPVRAIYSSDGVLDGDIFSIFSTSVYSVADGTLGSISGSLNPSIAGNAIGVVFTAGQDAKFYDGVTYRSISFPDGAYVTKVLEQKGRFIFIRADSHRYYYTEPLADALDGSGNMVISGAGYESAENKPDWLVDALSWRDRLILGGKETIDIHGVTGDADAPWQPILGASIGYGVFGTGAMSLWNDTFAWASPERTIWRYNGSTAERISDAGVEERLKNYDTILLDSFFFEGREFLHVYGDDTLPDLILDASTGQWCEWETNSGPFGGGPSTGVGQDYPIFGSKSTARPVTISSRTTFGNGYAESTIEYRFRFGVPLDGGAVPMHNIGLRCQTYSSGTVTASLRTSRDKGNSWTGWKDRTISGSIRNKVEWRAQGIADSPGFLCEVKTAGATEFSVSGAYFNEFVQGRSRG